MAYSHFGVRADFIYGPNAVFTPIPRIYGPPFGAMTTRMQTRLACVWRAAE